MWVDISIWIFLFLFAMFFLAGFVDSIAGGGGLISVPALLITGFPAAAMIGTNKMSHAPGTTMALINYARNGLIVWRVALIGIPFCLIFSVLGANTLLSFDNETIGKIIVFLLPVGIAATLFPKKAASVPKEISKVKLYIATPLVCSLIGFYDGFFGPGAGSFFILALHYIIGLDLVKSAGTTKVLNLTTMGSSLMVFIYNGQYVFMLALPLAAASIMGNLLGSRMAIKIGATFVRKILTVSLSLLFVTLIWRVFIQG